MRATLAFAVLGLAHGLVASIHHPQTCQTKQIVNGVPFPTMIDATLEDLESGLETGLFTSVDLVRTYMDRIIQVNGTLHMVTELNPDALSIAAELDKQRAAGNITGPLQ